MTAVVHDVHIDVGALLAPAPREVPDVLGDRRRRAGGRTAVVQGPAGHDVVDRREGAEHRGLTGVRKSHSVIRPRASGATRIVLFLSASAAMLVVSMTPCGVPPRPWNSSTSGVLVEPS